jgi:hypothetical protein
VETIAFHTGIGIFLRGREEADVPQASTMTGEISKQLIGHTVLWWIARTASAGQLARRKKSAPSAGRLFQSEGCSAGIGYALELGQEDWLGAEQACRVSWLLYTCVNSQHQAAKPLIFRRFVENPMNRIFCTVQLIPQILRDTLR